MGGRLATVAVSVFLAMSVVETSAYAQPQVTATAKGVVGCALLGGELVISVTSAVGLRNSWALAGVTLLGAVGGGIGGYFLETGTGTSAPTWSVASLAAGILLLIPATVIVASSTAYQPGSEAIAPPTDTGGEVAPAPASPGDAPEQPAPPPAGGTEAPSGSLFHLHDGRLALGAPAPLLIAAFSADEVRRYGVSPQFGLSFPVMRVSW